MANSKQAKKRARQNITRNARNSSRRSEMRTYVKRVVKAIVEGNKEVAVNEFKLASSMLDKLANKGLIHKNAAARKKSRLNRRIKLLNAA